MVNIQRITDHTILFTSSAMQVNATLLMHEGLFFLIDTMLRPQDSQFIRAFLEERDLPLDYIINTHWHSDHCFGNRILKLPQTQIVAHKLHRETLSRERNMFKAGKPAPLGQERVPEVDITFEQNACYRDGQIIMDQDVIDDSPIQIIHAGGHSPDLSYIYLPQEKLLIAGDNVLNCDDPQIALPYFYWDDEERLIQSLQMILELDVELIIPGHGAPVYRLKIEEDLGYLTAMQQQAVLLVANDSFTDASHLEHVLNVTLDALHLYPNSEGKSIWVPQAHAMNLKRLALKYFAQ